MTQAPMTTDKANDLINQGIALAMSGYPFDAVDSFNQAINLNPNLAVAYNNRGNALLDLGLFKEAANSFAQAISLNPNYSEAFYNLGNTAQYLNLYTEAILHYSKAISLRSDFAEAYNNLGIVLTKVKRLDQAIESFDQALALNPDFVCAHNNRATTHQEILRLKAALTEASDIYTLTADDAEAYINGGNTLLGIEDFDKALLYYDKAIYLKPDDAVAHYNRGLALEKSGQLLAALNAYASAITLNPMIPEAYNNQGLILTSLNRTAEAIASFEQALTLRPDFAEVFNNLGNIFKDLHRFDEALDCYEQAIVILPGFAYAHWNKAFLKLLTGDYETGWRLNEWRRKIPNAELYMNFSQPLWLGEESVAGKTLLIYQEQGLGDFIQFCRYLPMLNKLGAKIIIHCLPTLTPLISTLPGNFTFVTNDQALPDFDLHCPIMSLPLAFHTTLPNIPNAVPYLFADAQKAKIWQNRLGIKSAFRIGVAWSGSTTHKNDSKRSIPLKFLATLFDCPLEFHALQNEIRDADKADLSVFDTLILHTDQLNDFSDTAALIAQMDLIISVDTSVAHLAGALGKPVWIMLPFSPDFRWLLDRDDSPWYPSARLLRQKIGGDWISVIAEVIEKLKIVILQTRL